MSAERMFMGMAIHRPRIVWRYQPGGADAWHNGYRLRIWAHCDIPASRCELHGFDVLDGPGMVGAERVVASGICGSAAAAQAAAVEVAEAGR